MATTDPTLTTVPDVEEIIDTETTTVLPSLRIEHSVSRATQDRMLMNLIIFLSILGGMKLIQMVIYKALNQKAA